LWFAKAWENGAAGNWGGGTSPNNRPVILQPNDNGIRIGGQKGRSPDGTQTDPQSGSPQPKVEWVLQKIRSWYTTNGKRSDEQRREFGGTLQKTG